MLKVQQQTWIAVLLAIVFPTITTWIYFIHFDGRSPGVAAVSKVMQFAFPACWVFLWMRMTAKDAGLPKPEGNQMQWSTQTNLLFGVVWGVAIAVAMIVYYGIGINDRDFGRLANEIDSRVRKLSLANPLGFAALGAFYSLAHSFLEEYYFRWFVYGQLRHLLSFIPAAAISGLAFMAHHVIVLYVFFGFSFHTLFLSLSIAVGGFIWAWQYERSRSLVGAWISHLLVDAGIFLIGYHMIFVVLPAR